MLLSTPTPKFLIDENVRIELFRFLKHKGFDVAHVPTSASDNLVASLSKSEERILVTNDEDFTTYGKEQVFSVIWLRIPQHDVHSLLDSFNKLLRSVKDLLGKLIVLKIGEWNEFQLGTYV